MCFVRTPMVGYRVLPMYSHLLPQCEGRPDEYALSALYTFDGVEGYDEVHSQLMNPATTAKDKKYPGAH